MQRKIIDLYGLVTDTKGDDADSLSNKNHFKVAFCNLSLTLKDGTPAAIPGTKHLFIGSIGSAYNLEGLEAAGITHVLCLSEVILTKYEDKFTYLRVCMLDKVDYDLSADLSHCYDFLQSARRFCDGKVLVHCYQGKSRSAAVCCAYLITHYGLTYDDALAAIRTVRPTAAPNSHFERILRRLQPSISTDNDSNNDSSNNSNHDDGSEVHTSCISPGSSGKAK